MKYLVDSDYIADYLVVRPQATELLSSLALESISISLITPLEIALYVMSCSKCRYFHGPWCATGA